MRISDWSSDVCSSDLVQTFATGHPARAAASWPRPIWLRQLQGQFVRLLDELHDPSEEGSRGSRAADAEHRRVLQFVLKEAAEHGAPRMVERAQRRSEERRVGKEGVSTC